MKKMILSSDVILSAVHNSTKSIIYFGFVTFDK